MGTIRTGRASVNLLDNVRVDYYGTPTPVNQVANLHVPEPGMITIQPWDTSQIAPIEKDGEVHTGCAGENEICGLTSVD